MIINNDSRRSQRIPLHNRHIMILKAQIITLIPRVRIIQFPISLIPRIAHIPLLPIKRNIIIKLILPIRIMREIAERVDDFLVAVGEMRARPGLADAAAPIEFPVVIEAAVFGAGFEAGVFVVDGFGAEVLGDEGGV